MNDCKKNLKRSNAVNYDEVLRLHLQGLTAGQIAIKMGRAEGGVANAITQMRKAYGVERVPYLKDVQRQLREAKAEKVKKPEQIPTPKRTPSIAHPCFKYEIPETWAGAFRMLALYLDRSGDTEGLELAKHIAKQKGMRL
jgi:hypothetical protein